MKKRILFSAIALFAAGMFSAEAQLNVQQEFPLASSLPGVGKMLKQSPFRAAEDGGYIEIGFCQDPVYSVGFRSTNKTGAAIEVPQSTALKWTGKQIAKVRVGIGTPKPTKMQLFFTYNLNDEPFYTQDVVPAEEKSWNEFVLTTPYTIEKRNFYIGFTVVPETVDERPMAFDGQPTGYTANYLYYTDQTGKQSWTLTSAIGASSYGNICIVGLIEGDDLPQNDVSMEAVDMPTVLKVNNAFEIEGQFTNRGAKTVKNFEVTYAVGSMSPVTKAFTLSSPLANRRYAVFTISDAYSDYEGDNVPVTIAVTKVNGEDDENPSDNEVTVMTKSSNTVFDRTVVIEEATGTWNGWCPRGIVAMEYMKETYPDSFIGIAVHKSGLGSDPMVASSYANFNLSAPSSKANRKSIWNGVSPTQQNYETMYKYERNLPSEAKIDLVARYADEAKSSVELYTTTTFGLDIAAASYHVAFVVLENEVGPYNQENYFSKEGYNQGNMGGWEDMAPQASALFDDVARDIFSYSGLSNSVPTTVKKEQVYEYSCTASLSNVTNTDNIELVAMLLNATSGEIVNAVKIPASAIGAFGGVADNVADGSVSITAGKGEIRIAGDCDNAAVYGIDGRLVKASAESTINVPAGLYIVKASANGKPAVAKVLVK